MKDKWFTGECWQCDYSVVIAVDDTEAEDVREVVAEMRITNHHTGSRCWMSDFIVELVEAEP